MITVEAFWSRLHATLSIIEGKIAILEPTIIRDIGCTANDSFVLRGYLALRRNSDSDEIAITVDVHGDGEQVTITSDVCRDDGRVLMVGPSAVIRSSDADPVNDSELQVWLDAFAQFLLSNESAILLAVSALE